MIEMGKMSMGDCIKWYRRMKKLSRDQLATEVGVTTLTVGNWERDEAVPGLYYVLDLSKILGVTMEQIMGEVQPEPYIDDRYLTGKEIASELGINVGSARQFYRMSDCRIRISKTGITAYHMGDMVTYINRYSTQK